MWIPFFEGVSAIFARVSIILSLERPIFTKLRRFFAGILEAFWIWRYFLITEGVKHAESFEFYFNVVFSCRNVIVLKFSVLLDLSETLGDTGTGPVRDTARHRHWTCQLHLSMSMENTDTGSIWGRVGNVRNVGTLRVTGAESGDGSESGPKTCRTSFLGFLRERINMGWKFRLLWYQVIRQ